MSLPKGATWRDVALGAVPFIAYLLGGSIAYHTAGFAGLGVATALFGIFILAIRRFGDPDAVRANRNASDGEE